MADKKTPDYNALSGLAGASALYGNPLATTHNEFVLFHMIMKTTKAMLELRTAITPLEHSEALGPLKMENFDKALAELFEQAERFGSNA